MTKVDRRVSMDQAVWDELDSEAGRTGRSADDLLEDAVRRNLARRRVKQVLDDAAEAAIPESEAAQIARAELLAYRRAI